MTSTSQSVKVLFASASDPVVALALERFRGIFPELPLVVVSEFPVPEAEWIPYHIRRSWRENRELIQARLAGRRIRLAAVILEPRIPHWRLRALGFALAPLHFLAFNETGEHFMLRPRSVPTMLRHLAWRMKNLVRSQLQPESSTYRAVEWFRKPGKFRLSILYRMAMGRGRSLAKSRPVLPPAPLSENQRPRGISVVIPSRNGRDLLAQCLPGIPDADEIIVVDNGSDDGTAEYLSQSWPQVSIEHSPQPLAFAVAVNRGIRRARFSHVCVLNNDMRIEPGFFRALLRPFENVPDLFCSTAQIFFPEGRRREETGKTVMNSSPGVTGFPVRCDIPLEGEDHSYVLYGSGGCTLYDAAKLEAAGGFDEIYQPAYVEDLDLGVRAWLRGWPSVYCAEARVLHEHRATTARYFSAEQLDRALEINYVQFLARAIGDPETFSRLWRHNVLRLKALEKEGALSAAAHQPAAPVPAGDMRFLDLVNGEVAVFPGRAASGKPVILVASPYVPFPLSHGAAVRIYNLMRRAAADFDQVLVAFTEESVPVPKELAEICAEVVTVRRAGSHALPSRGRPDTVEEFDTPAFHAALRQTIAKWRPGIVQLEFTQMAQYASECAPASTILVEHDITYDLYAQMLATGNDDWEIRRQHELWTSFETAAWRQVDCVVTMSEKDRALVSGATAIPNGVDLERFQPTSQPPDPRRLLFIGSFAHRPNVLALEFFLRDVFPRLANVRLHVIAGQRHQRFWDLQHAGVEVDGFVSDVRPAYQRATLVIAPLVASAGTNVKILEAMAMGKAIVSTEAGIHGLELQRSADVVVTDSAEAMAAAITRLLENPVERVAIETHARQTVERVYGWDAIAREQKRLYESLLQLPRKDRVV
ncbi:MAG: glycosyl transferase, family 2 [Bryobacterales bacterium]|nr:glycosyl transferase, family 2 [Bryobacterales bacterium]